MTGAKHLSLSQSIQDLAGAEARTAAIAQRARRMMSSTSTTLSTTKLTRKRRARHPTSTALNPIAQKISSHPQLATKVRGLLPAG